MPMALILYESVYESGNQWGISGRENSGGRPGYHKRSLGRGNPKSTSLWWSATFGGMMKDFEVVKMKLLFIQKSTSLWPAQGHNEGTIFGEGR